MAKKRKYRSLPKRIAGVKIPKAVRRAADTPLGAAMIAGIVIEIGARTIDSRQVREALGDMRDAVGRAAIATAGAVQSAAANASDAISGEPKSRRSRRLRQEDDLMAH